MKDNDLCTSDPSLLHRGYRVREQECWDLVHIYDDEINVKLSVPPLVFVNTLLLAIGNCVDS